MNRAKGTFETEPREFLSPFKGEGRRRKVEGSVESDGDRHRVQVRVWVETNRELDKPLEAREARWRDRHDDAAAAQVLLARIRKILEQGDAVVVVGASPR